MAASALLTTPIRSSICVSSVFVFFVFTLVVSVLQNPTFCYGKTSTFVRKTEKGHDMPADSDVFSDLPGMKSHSQDFLLVIPIDGLGQCMSPVEYRSILKYRLMIPLFSAGEVCPIPNCRRVLDAFGEHAVHCKELPVFKYRHDLVRDVLCDTFRRAGISVKKEAPMNFLTDPRDGRSTLRPADVLVFGWSGGKHACIDLTGVSPLVGLGNRPFVVGQAACRAASAKVHITQGDHEGKAVIVSWVTMKEPGSKTVSYWKDGESKNKKVEKGKITTYKYYTYKSGYIHHCTIRHLEFDTKYHYEVGSGDSSRTFWFKTPPQAGPDVPYTFGLIGDLGQSFDSNRTLTHYQKNPSKGQTVLYVGDLSYADNFTHHDNTKWDTWGRFVERSTAYQPWIWTAGNHEIDFAPEIGETKPFKPFTHRYPTPYRASNSTAPFWYSIKRGPAYIIVLSSYSAYGKYTPQYTWLKEELPKVNRSETPWLIVLMHSPWYNSNNYHYMEGESMRVVYEPWFIDYKVDLVFAGHVHAYERSKRISNIAYNIVNGECKPTIDESAPVYITIGDGGNLEGLALNMTYPQPEYSAFREASFGHAILEIKNRTHAYYAWHRNQDGFAVEADKMWFFNRVWHPVNDLEIA